MFTKIRFFISPYFIIKFPLLRDIKKMVNRYNFKGETLDVGCGQMPYKYLFTQCNYKGIDFDNYSKNKDFFGEKPHFYFSNEYSITSKLPFDNEQFDTVLFFQVLEHHKDTHTLLKEVNRILKPNGQIMFSVPFIEGIHESPHDYYRFTEFGLRELLTKFGFKELCIRKQGRLFSVLYFLTSEALNKFASHSRTHYLMSFLLYLFIFLPLQYICMFFLDKLVKNEDIVINYLIVATKIRDINVD